MWKKSATLVPLLVLLFTLGAWGFSNIDHRLTWLALGIPFGLAVGLGYIITERRQAKRAKDLLVLCFVIVTVLIVLLSKFFSELYGFVAGMFLPVVITMLTYQVINKQIITWDDI